MLRPRFLLLLAALVGPTQAATAAPAPVTDAMRITADLEVTRLHDDVWLHTSWSTYEGARVPSNGLLVREGDGLVLVDTAWGVAPTLALVEWVDRTLKLPITRAVVTHSHDDRMGGAAVLVERGIPYHGHPRTADLARRQSKPPPTALDTVSEAGASTPLGSLVVIYPGPGHTVDNLMVWLPRARVLVGGCAVKSAASTDLGYIGEADLAAWPESIRRVMASIPDDGPIVVVPGHGSPGGRELLTHTIALLETAPRP